MISCMICKNNGYCPLWKSRKVEVRTYCESFIDPTLYTVKTFRHGGYIAGDCKKFQKMT